MSQLETSNVASYVAMSQLQTSKVASSIAKCLAVQKGTSVHKQMTHHYCWLFQFWLSVHQLSDPQSSLQHTDQPLHPLCPGLLWGCAVHWWWWASTVWRYCKQQTDRHMMARQGIAGSQQCVLWCCMLLLRDVSKECTASIFRVWVNITQHHNTDTK